MAASASLVPELKPVVLQHAKSAFDKIKEVDPDNKQDLASFLKEITDPAARPVENELGHPLTHYFISSSHNTYLTGNQLWSKSSTDTYRDALTRGCRCIEIDVWDGGTPSSSSSSSDAEQNENKKPDGDNELRKLTTRVRRGLRAFRSQDASSRIRIEQTSTNTSAAEQVVMPMPWRTTSGRAEPRVLHGYTATKEISFRKVAEIVRDFAFRTSDLPVIVSLEVHCSKEQQEVMVEIIKDYWGCYLIDPPEDYNDSTPLPTLESVRNKILIKVKYTPPEKVFNAPDGKALGRTRALSHVVVEETQIQPKSGLRSPLRASSILTQQSSDDEAETQTEPTKKSKICEALGSLGVYTRSCHYHSLQQPEAAFPNHVFALGEGKISEVQKQDAKGLFKHNVDFFMRVYPKGSRVRSSNLDPAPLWRQGTQMVALNWQELNTAMMLNEAMFDSTGGWMLKPEGYRISGNDVPTSTRSGLNLSIRVFAGQNLCTNPQRRPAAYVKCELHVEGEPDKIPEQIPGDGSTRAGERKQKSAVRQGCDPDWGGQLISFVGMKDVVPELSFVRGLDSRGGWRQRQSLRDHRATRGAARHEGSRVYSAASDASAWQSRMCMREWMIRATPRRTSPWFKVMDEYSYGKDQMLGWACHRLDRLPQGLCLLRLKDTDARNSDGALLVECTSELLR
nr:1-phosphatidylinositol 4,5-bisphosphate phosphodiesterase 1 [Quercus suber]